MNNKTNILIVGGGTAGWITAAYLARKIGITDNFTITLIESPNISTIGVGEGTFPSMRLTLSSIGIDEAEMMRACDATFKHGIVFRNWMKPIDGKTHSYFHPFSSPKTLANGEDLAPYWLRGMAANGVSFADAVTLQDKIVSAHKAPKRLSDQAYSGPLNYAYHVNAGKLAEYLSKVAVSLGVRQLLGTVEEVELNEAGEIAAIHSAEYGRQEADLFIDCTGFRGTLIEKALGAPFNSLSDELFVDKALTVQIPYENEGDHIPSTTVSTAQGAGWIWDIGLTSRRGIGHVYSSRHMSDAEAEKTIRSYLGTQHQSAELRALDMRVGYRKTPWTKNCIAIGLSGGFLEPLESTGILMIEAAAHLLASLYHEGQRNVVAATQFNKAMTERYRCAADFIKLHFCISDRTDSQFWIDNADKESWSEGLRHKIDLWSHKVPDEYDLDSVHESFRFFNYQYVLYGMNRYPKLRDSQIDHSKSAALRAEFERIAIAGARAAEVLPTQREICTNLEEGFAAVDLNSVPRVVAR